MSRLRSSDDESISPDRSFDAQMSKVFFTRRQLWKLSAAGIAAGFCTPALLATLTPSRASAAGPLPWADANAILASVTPPTFPNTNFVVTSYGAHGDGTTDNTAAFQKAITACNAAGGHVIVPAGTYVTGAIYLKSHVDLHLDAGSTLMFSGDASKYPLVLTRYESIECLNHSPMIYAHGETNIALTGSGILDASHTASWNKGSDRVGVLEPMVAAGIPPLQRNVAGKLRSTFVEPYSSTAVLIQGVTLQHAQFWQLHPTLCQNVTVDGVTTSTSIMNTDGCDPECCDHVVIKNCALKAGDDSIAIKSGRDADGRRINVPTQNVVIWNNVFEGPFGGISLGSELTGGIQNIYAYNNSISKTTYALHVKSNTQRGGFVKNIYIDTLHGAKMGSEVVLMNMNYGHQTGSFLPDFSGPFNLSNIVFDTAPIVLNLSGLSNDNIGTFNLSNSTFTNITNAIDSVQYVKNLTYTNVTINGKKVGGNGPISNLLVADTANAANWSVQSNIQVGATLYGDRTFTLASLPPTLLGAAWIRTANSSKHATNNPLATFTLSRQANVYVALDLRVGSSPRRAWMDATWSDTGLNLSENESGTQQSFRLYKKTFPSGPVALGPNAGVALSSMYTVIVI